MKHEDLSMSTTRATDDWPHQSGLSDERAMFAATNAAPARPSATFSESGGKRETRGR